MKLRKLMGLAAFLVVCGASYASEALGLEEILEQSKISNPKVKAEKMNVESKKELKDKALKNWILPEVTLSSNNDWDILKEYGLKDEISASATVFSGGRDFNRYRKAKTELAMAEKESVLREISAQEEAVDHYFGALNAKKQMEITNQAIKALEKQRARVNDLYTNGKLVPKSEVLKIDADIEYNRGINLENAHNEGVNIRELARILGYSIDSELELNDFDPAQYLANKAHLQEENNKAVESTILGEKEQLKLDSAAYDVKIAQSELLPTVYTSYTKYNKDISRGNIYDRDEDEFSIGFRWVLSWGATWDNVKSTKYAYEKAKIEYEDNLQGISLDMKNKLSEIKALYGKSLAMKKRVDLLEENMEIDSMRYENELLSTFDYLNSVNSFREAQENHYALQRELVLAVIEYENLYR